MRPVYLIALLFATVLLLSTCDKESTTQSLEGKWFRSYPNQIWGGHNQPSFERGESHVTISFDSQGEFMHNRTVLGIYEGTSISDTSAIIIESGTYSKDDEAIDITLSQRIWWDAFYDDMAEFETSGFVPGKYIDMTYQIIGDELKIEYFVATDDISPQQETQGLDKFEETYTRL